MKAEWILGSLLVLFTVSKTVLTQSPQFSFYTQPNEEGQKLGEEIRAKDLLVRYLLSHPSNDKFLQEPGILAQIPFRPSRKLGSEFLGKRSADGGPLNEGESEVGGFEIEKRRTMGSEFLGKKRRLGSEFLGKRANGLGSEGRSEEETEAEGHRGWARLQGPHPFRDSPLPANSKRALGSEFLGKRAGDLFRPNWPLEGMGPWTPNFKARQLLQKKRRMMGSEFLGKRSVAEEQSGPKGTAL